MSSDVSASDKSRRSADRYPLNADVEVLEPFNTHGVVINASDGGLRVAVEDELPVDATCVIEVQLEEGKILETARVVWSREHPDGFLVGFEFVTEPPQNPSDGAAGG